ncbi:MAG: hypothetical protein ACLQIJ_18225 [Polyangia bacterium]
MRTSRIASLVAVGAIFLPLLASTASTVAASPRATLGIGKRLAELKASDAATNASFGWSVAVSGGTAVVGANGYGDGAGRAYVFTKSGDIWKQAAELQGSDTVAYDGFGCSVAIAGTTVVVGAPGHANNAGRAYVFAKSATGWEQTAELKGSDTISGNNDGFGAAVAISGTTMVVSAPGYASNTGRAYVFTKMAGVWTQVAELQGSGLAADDDFGSSVAIAGPTVVVGAYAGSRAYVFTKTETGWKQAARLQGSGVVVDNEFGTSVAVSGGTAVVGACGAATLPGRVYIFTKSGDIWKQAAELQASDTVADDDFGGSVAIAGPTIVVGAEWIDARAGRAYFFTKTRFGWKQALELKASDTVANDRFGTAVAISGTTAVIGAYNHANFSGRAYVFEA